MALWNSSKKKEPEEVVQPATMLERIDEIMGSLEHFEANRVEALEKLTGEKLKTETELNKSIADLDEQLAKLKLKRKIDEEDLAHMIKMSNDRLELKYEKDLMAEQKKHQGEIATLKSDHNDEIKELQQEAMAQLKRMYSEILERLPNLNATLKIKNDGSGNS